MVVVQWPREDLAADAVADHEVNLWRMALGRRPILLRDLAAGGVVILGFGFHRFLGFLEGSMSKYVTVAYRSLP